jgi:hypothetical protein
MNSMTMHILGGLVDAAMKSTTLGCRKAVITRTCAIVINKLINATHRSAQGGCVPRL